MRKLLLLLILVCPAFAAVSFDTSASGFCTAGTDCTGTDSAQILTYAGPNVTGANANRAMLIWVTVSGPATSEPAVSSVVRGGSENATAVSSCTVGTLHRTECWQIIAPAGGTGNIVVSLATAMTSAQEVIASGAMVFYGVDQTTPFTGAAGNSGTGTSATLTLGASNAGDMVADQVCNGTSIGTTSQTSLYDNVGNTLGACNEIGGARGAGGTTSLSWTGNGSDSWLMLGVIVKAAGAAATPNHRVIVVM